MAFLRNNREAQENLDDSMASADAQQEAAADFLGDDELKYKGKPVKGYKFCVFNIFMIVLMLIIVYFSMTNKDGKSIDIIDGDGKKPTDSGGDKPVTPSKNDTTGDKNSTKPDNTGS